MPISKNIGQHIKRIRNDKGYSQEYVALKANISRPTVSDVETGKRNPSLDVAEDIANALDMDFWQLAKLASEVTSR